MLQRIIKMLCLPNKGPLLGERDNMEFISFTYSDVHIIVVMGERGLRHIQL